MMDYDEEQRVAAGYDVVYAALPRSATFARIWREHAAGADFPEGFEHISFVTLAELHRMTDALQLSPDALLVDLACGMGGPGLWIARERGARLRGVDVSPVAVAAARACAEALGLSAISEFSRGSFGETPPGAFVRMKFAVDPDGQWRIKDFDWFLSISESNSPMPIPGWGGQ